MSQNPYLAKQFRPQLWPEGAKMLRVGGILDSGPGIKGISFIVVERLFPSAQKGLGFRVRGIRLHGIRLRI